MESRDKLELRSTLVLGDNPELYKVVDFLNRNLKEKNVIFGLTQENDKMTIHLYET